MPLDGVAQHGTEAVSCVAPSCSLCWVRIQEEERGGDRQSHCGRHLAPVTRATSVYRLVCQVCAGCSLEKVMTPRFTTATSSVQRDSVRADPEVQLQ